MARTQKKIDICYAWLPRGGRSDPRVCHTGRSSLDAALLGTPPSFAPDTGHPRPGLALFCIPLASPDLAFLCWARAPLCFQTSWQRLLCTHSTLDVHSRAQDSISHRQVTDQSQTAACMPLITLSMPSHALQGKVKVRASATSITSNRVSSQLGLSPATQQAQQTVQTAGSCMHHNAQHT